MRTQLATLLALVVLASPSLAQEPEPPVVYGPCVEVKMPDGRVRMDCSEARELTLEEFAAQCIHDCFDPLPQEKDKWDYGRWLKLSFIGAPGERNAPAVTEFDTEGLNYFFVRSHRHGWDWGSSQAKAEVAGRSLGFAFRLQTPIGLGLHGSLLRGPRTTVSLDLVQHNYADIGTAPCPPNSGLTGPCAVSRYEGTGREHIQHDIDLYTFTWGLHYDIFQRNRFISLEPGLGLGTSFVRRVSRRRHMSDFHGRSVVTLEDSRRTVWHGVVENAYASLSADIYPLGKNRHLGIGATTRYLLWQDEWPIRGSTLAQEYAIGFRTRQWSTTVTATLAF